MEERLSIRKMRSSDIKVLTDIWLETSLKAHHFISANFWKDQKDAMQNQYLPAAETYVAEHENGISGFVSLSKNRIAAIFVSPEKQGKGIGSSLIDYVKGMREELILHVYQNNDKSVKFYRAKGFEIISGTVDKHTQEKEFIMRWCKNTGNI